MIDMGPLQGILQGLQSGAALGQMLRRTAMEDEAMKRDKIRFANEQEFDDLRKQTLLGKYARPVAGGMVSEDLPTPDASVDFSSGTPETRVGMKPARGSLVRKADPSRTVKFKTSQGRELTGELYSPDEQFARQLEQTKASGHQMEAMKLEGLRTLQGMGESPGAIAKAGQAAAENRFKAGQTAAAERQRKAQEFSQQQARDARAFSEGSQERGFGQAKEMQATGFANAKSLHTTEAAREATREAKARENDIKTARSVYTKQVTDGQRAIDAFKIEKSRVAGDVAKYEAELKVNTPDLFGRIGEKRKAALIGLDKAKSRQQEIVAQQKEIQSRMEEAQRQKDALGATTADDLYESLMPQRTQSTPAGSPTGAAHRSH